MISFLKALKFNAAVFCNGMQSNVQPIQNQGLVKISHILRLNFFFLDLLMEKNPRNATAVSMQTEMTNVRVKRQKYWQYDR
jgi:hypothetical protein